MNQPASGLPVELPDDLERLCAQLEELSPQLQNIDDWPAEQIRLLADAGVLAWGLPAEFGGHLATDVQVMAAYERLAAACLTTTFVLTQRNAACQRIAASANFEMKSGALAGALPRRDLCHSRDLASDDVAAAPGAAGGVGRRSLGRVRAEWDGSLGDGCGSG